MTTEMDFHQQYEDEMDQWIAHASPADLEREGLIGDQLIHSAHAPVDGDVWQGEQELSEKARRQAARRPLTPDEQALGMHWCPHCADGFIRVGQHRAPCRCCLGFELVAPERLKHWREDGELQQRERRMSEKTEVIVQRRKNQRAKARREKELAEAKAATRKKTKQERLAESMERLL